MYDGIDAVKADFQVNFIKLASRKKDSSKADIGFSKQNELVVLIVFVRSVTYQPSCTLFWNKLYEWKKQLHTQY